MLLVKNAAFLAQSANAIQKDADMLVDGGRILAQKAVDVRPGDTPETLQRRVMEEAEWVLLPRAVEELCAEITKERAV